MFAIGLPLAQSNLDLGVKAPTVRRAFARRRLVFSV